MRRALSWISAIFGAAAFGLAVAPVNAWYFGLVALVPWFVAIQRSRLAETIGGSLVVGLACGISVGIWVPNALAELRASSAMGITGLVVTALWVKGVWFGALGTYLYLVRRLSTAWLAGAAGAGFALNDIVAGSWTWGVPWALLGHSQAGVPGVAQLAVVGGVPLLSAVLAAFSMSVACCWVRRDRASYRLLASLAAAWCAMAALGMPLAHWLRPEAGQTPATQLMLVQPNLPRGERWAAGLQSLHITRTGEYTERALAASHTRPHAVLWPENLLTSPLDESPELEAHLHRWVKRLGVPVVFGAARSPVSGEPEHYRSSVLIAEPERGITAAIDKQRAVPILEAAGASWLSRRLSSAFGRAADWKKVEEAPAAGPVRAGFTASPLLCYEALIPSLAAARRTPDSIALVNLADDSWVADVRATEQLASFATFRAIEQRLPLVRVAHGGLSLVTDEFGQVTERLPMDEYASTTVRLRPLPPPTLGEKFGLLALPVFVGMGVWWLLGWRYRS